MYIPWSLNFLFLAAAGCSSGDDIPISDEGDNMFVDAEGGNSDSQDLTPPKMPED